MAKHDRVWSEVKCGKLQAKQKGIIMSKVSPMSDEFHDWLESCPVRWFRGEVTKDHVAYYFETPEEDEDEE